MRQQVVVVLVVLLSTMVFPPQTSAGGMGSEDPGVTDVVTWRVGDKWVYAGAFDPTVLVQSAGVDATVGTINGDSTTTVDSITQVDINGVQTCFQQLLTTQTRMYHERIPIICLSKASLVSEWVRERK